MDDKCFPPDTRPKGWLSIEEYLPMMYAIDIIQGYTTMIIAMECLCHTIMNLKERSK